MGSNVNETPKRHILARVRVVWAIKRENLSSRLTCRWVDKKRYKWINKKNLLYFTHLLRSPHRRICTKFGAAVGTANVIACTKFFSWSVKGVYSAGVENCHLPLTKPVAVNTGLALPRSPWCYRHAKRAEFLVHTETVRWTRRASSEIVPYGRKKIKESWQRQLNRMDNINTKLYSE